MSYEKWKYIHKIFNLNTQKALVLIQLQDGNNKNVHNTVNISYILLYPYGRLLCMLKFLSFSCVQLFATPMDYVVHGILQARILEWEAFPFSRGVFPIQGSNPGLMHCRQILYKLTYKGSLGRLLFHTKNGWIIDKWISRALC